MNGSQVAYHLRVNKYIDRQIFIEALNLVNRFIPVAGHGYVSMAGAYMEDCRVLHQAVRISRMYSFDTKAAVVARQAINRPYGFVQTHQKSSGQVVQQFEQVRNSLGGAETNVVVWLDYTSAGDRIEQLQQLGTLVTKMGAGDIVRITMNAHRTTLGQNADYESLPAEQKPVTVHAWRLATLKAQLGDYLPANRDSSEYLQSKEGFFQTLMQAVKHAVIQALHPRPELHAFPILSTAYEDGQGMITATCVIIKAAQIEQFKTAVRWEVEWAHKPGPDWDQYVEIQVPFLSLQERHILHGTAQPGGWFEGELPNFVKADELEQYRIHYCRYPTFAPLDIL